MDNLQDSINMLNNNIVLLNRNIQTLLSGNNSGSSGGFSIELLKDALLNVEVQELLVEIVNYNHYNRKPLVKDDRKPLENTQTAQITQQKVMPVQQQKVQQEPKIEVEEKPQPIVEETQFTNSEIVETLYTVEAPKNGYFKGTDKINDIFRTQFQIDVFGDDGEFFIPDNVDPLRFLLKPEKFLLPACSGEFDFNPNDFDATKVKITLKTLKKGVVKKDETGWKIVKKAVLRIEKGQIKQRIENNET